MNAEQKRAWLGVWSGVAVVVGYLILLPFAGPIVAAAAFALLGVNGFAGLIGRKEKMDERDVSITRRATLGGAIVSYLAFVLGCMGTWFVVFAWQRNEEVCVHVFPEITMFGGIVFYFVRSVVVLVLYGRHVEAERG